MLCSINWSLKCLRFMGCQRKCFDNRYIIGRGTPGPGVWCLFSTQTLYSVAIRCNLDNRLTSFDTTATLYTYSSGFVALYNFHDFATGMQKNIHTVFIIWDRRGDATTYRNLLSYNHKPSSVEQCSSVPWFYYNRMVCFA